MRFSFWAATVAASVLLSFPVYAMPPVEAFGNLPQVSAMRLSADGHHIAAIQPISGRPQVTIFSFGSSGVRQYAFTVQDGIARSVRWAGNGRLVAVYQENTKTRSDTELRNWQRAFSIDAEAKNPVRLMATSWVGTYNVHTGAVLDAPADDPTHVFMQALQAYAYGDPDTRLSRGKIKLNVFRVDLGNGHGEPAETGNDETVQWVMDGGGHAVARVDQDVNLHNVLMIGGGNSWRPVFSYGASDDVYVAGLMEDGAALAVVRRNQAGMLALYPLQLADGKIGPPLFSDPDVDLADVVTDEWTGRIIGVAYQKEKTEFTYFDPKRQALQRKLEALLPGQTVEIESVDASGDAYIVRSSSPRQPTIHQLFDPKSSQLSFLAAEYAALTGSDLGKMTTYTYKARDGLDIHAYLTLPPGKNPRRLPTIVFPHGGPEARDTLDFDWWAQFMAGRGYAVLQPNFRGSAGYGAKFRDAGNGEWGQSMQSDITDGVRKLIADGTADPNRVCIVGASYGGYAALAGATFTPDLYACTVAYAPVSDLEAMLGKEAKRRGENSLAMSYWQARIGDRFSDEKRLAAVSPARHADQVKAPILIVHSDKDVTVPIAQGQIEADALRAAGKQVEFVTLEGDDHYLEFADTRIKLLKEVERFLDAHIGDHATAGTAAH
ncbi:MAG TPA: S9 family peptidase [Rhizomicrobium sp.]|jgi:dipeptidyl aminopeptidase/acylaminoacyl peptidase|nr:S9 family peptidase [Rhizomicrobium sp.]